MNRVAVIKIGLIGFGNVGQGVAKILKENADALTQRVGAQFQITKIAVRSIEKYRGLDLGEAVLTENVTDLLTDPSIDIIVEVMGGETPAFDYISDALKRGKYVVTANKEVVAKHKNRFFELARENQVDIYFEASVGGGIPIIRSFKVGYAANQIQSVCGILNGTTNYILTKMREEGLPFEQALKQAQDLGFAEADPSMDVSGLDAAYKLVILAAVAFKQDIQIEDLYYEGIDALKKEDVEYAKELGYTIKLLALGSRHTNQDHMIYKVHPTLILITHPLASVRNEFNAIFSVGNAIGETMIYGKGAGSLPTGSAVVSDLCDIAFDFHHNEIAGRRNLEAPLSKAQVLKVEDTVSAFYCRLLVEDHCGVLEQITHILGEYQISIAKVIQQEAKDEISELLLVTHQVSEFKFNQAIAKIESLDALRSVESKIRVGLGPKQVSILGES